MVRSFCSLLCALLLLGRAVPAVASVYAWGDNNSGQVGDGTRYTRRFTPVPVVSLTDVVAIAGGGDHSLALRVDGTVRAWGYNTSGQLGDGTTISRAVPVPVSGLGGVKAIAAGGWHSLATLDDGTVHTWGHNYYGQLGDGTTTDHPTPVLVSGLSGVVAIAAGGNHSLALLTDGTVHTWGHNDYGQLGDGTTTDHPTPVLVSGLSGVVAIAAGGNHSLALLIDGTMRAWGKNWEGQLGDGATTNRPTPVSVSGLTGVVAIAAGDDHSLALLIDGTMRAWGNSGWGQLGSGIGGRQVTPLVVSGLTGVVAIAAAADHSLAVLRDGTVRAWGYNAFGQVGDGTTDSIRGTPVAVVGLSGVVGIAAGGRHSLALISDDDFNGAREVDATPYRHAASTSSATTAGDDPIPSCVIRRPTNTVWYRFQPASAGTLTVTTAGSDYETIVALFTGTRGALTEHGCNYTAAGSGRSAVTDLPVVAGTDYYLLVGSASLGGGSLVLTASFSPTVAQETVYGWGWNGDGQLGDGTVIDRSTPILLRSLSGVVAIAVGSGHSLVLLSDGTVRAWGDNSYGQLGDGTTIDRSMPVPVNGLTAVVAIAGGGSHSLALLTDGTVRAWGMNSLGQLGNGTSLDQTTPVPVSGLSGVMAIAAGKFHSLALLADGTVHIWGLNASLQYVAGSGFEGPTFPVRWLSGAVAIAAGGFHGLALLSDGTVRAWGGNGYGQLGNGTTAYGLVAIPVSDLTGVVAIAGGMYHSLAVLSDGTVRAWGDNSYGQLGDGTTTSRSTPVPVSSLRAAVAIAGGGSHSLALLSDGTVRAWGSNTSGRLGDGTATNCSTPVLVSDLSGAVTIAAGETHSLALVAKLSLRTSGTGSGAVTSTPAGLVCRGTCTLEPPPGSGLILTATPDPGSVFTGWSGECTGTAHCILDLTRPQTVQAMFSPAALPQLHLALPSTELGVGDPLAVTATVTPGISTVADIYVALQLPDTSLLCLRGDGQLAPTCQPLVSNWTVAPFTGQVFQHTFTGSEPAGTYRWLAALTAPGTLTPLTGITETTVSVWPASEPALRTYLNSQSFRLGAPLTVGLSLDAAPGPLDRDVYVALQFPDGSLRFLDEAGQVTPTATPYLRHWTGAALVRKAFAYTFSGGEPVGTYKWLAAFVEPGTLNWVGPIVQAPFSFMP